MYMARDFIYIDSPKVKEAIMDALDMTEGGMSGNKLGLSSKVVPTVLINDWKMDRLNGSVTAVQNTWYTLATIKHSWVFYVIVSMATLAEDIECRVTIDGVAYTGAQAAAVAGAWYYNYLNGYDATMGMIPNTTTVVNIGYHTGVYVNEMTIEYRKTSNNGANALSCAVMYSGRDVVR